MPRSEQKVIDSLSWSSEQKVYGEKKKKIYRSEVTACFSLPFSRGKLSFTQNKRGSSLWCAAGTQNTQQDYVSHRMQHKPVVSPKASEAWSHTSDTYLELQGLAQICIWLCESCQWTSLKNLAQAVYFHGGLWCRIQSSAQGFTQHCKHCTALLLLWNSTAWNCRKAVQRWA